MSSPTSTNDTSDDVALSDAADIPEAIVRDAAVPASVALDRLRWVKRGIYAAVVVIGWVFISWSNRYRFIAPVVMLQLGWFAVVSAVYFLWHTGAAATAELDGSDPWWRPIGKVEELEREKRAMLKAIKEVDFDHQMGKQSAADAHEIIAVYRARAIEVIKAIDIAQGQAPASAREQIEREIKARVEVLGKSARAEYKTAQAANRDKKTKAVTPPVAVKAASTATIPATVVADPHAVAATSAALTGSETEELAP